MWSTAITSHLVYSIFVTAQYHSITSCLKVTRYCSMGDTSIINGYQSYKIQVYTVHVDQEILLLVQVPTNTKDGGQ